MRGAVTFWVEGVPAPQGSKTAFRHARTGRVVMVDDNRPRLKLWREAVSLEGRRAMGGADPLEGPMFVRLAFFMPRPKSHYGTGKNSGKVRRGAPQYPAGVPDLDKLCRGVFDGLTAGGVWIDDAQAVHLRALKHYVGEADGPGVLVTVSGVPV